jgi:hypothetical protein
MSAWDWFTGAKGNKQDALRRVEMRNTSSRGTGRTYGDIELRPKPARGAAAESVKGLKSVSDLWKR